MDRSSSKRRFVLLSLAATASWRAGTAGALLACTAARAAPFSPADASGAVREALARGADFAVRQLGRPDGFLGNDKVRIPLPEGLEKTVPLLRAVGRGRQIDDLVSAMNHAAEDAVALARPLLVDAVKTMSLQDAAQILQGGDHAATDFFATRTRGPLTAQFAPLVTRAVDKLSLAQRYNELAGKAGSLGLIRGRRPLTVQEHVTRCALDGLYFVIGEEERRIRHYPVGTGSALLRRVFSSL